MLSYFSFDLSGVKASLTNDMYITKSFILGMMKSTQVQFVWCTLFRLYGRIPKDFAKCRRQPSQGKHSQWQDTTLGFVITFGNVWDTRGKEHMRKI